MSCVVLTFHGIHDEMSEFRLDNSVDSRGLISYVDLENLIVAFISRGYKFKKFSEICAEKKEICLTFDDGYANNLILKKLVDKYKIPFTIFICGKFIAESKMFWWDIIHNMDSKINLAIFKRKYSSYILWKNYSERFSNIYLSEINRPLNIMELIDLSKNSYFELGCHTHTHTILNNVNKNDFVADVKKSIRFIEDVTGKRPRSFAFPDGDYINCPEILEFLTESFDAVAVVNQRIGYNSDGFISRIMLKTFDDDIVKMYFGIINSRSRRCILILKRWLSVNVIS